MNKFERIRATIKGESNDTVPYSFWTHFPMTDLDPVKLADETYEFFLRYDVDFVKTMNNGMYSIEDYGCLIDYSQIPKGGVANVISTPVQSEDDWSVIKSASIYEGTLARELKSLKLLLDKVGTQAPVVFTCFSPLTTAMKLSKGNLVQHINTEYGRSQVHNALREISISTCELVTKAIDMGAAGVFFASQSCTYDVFTEEQFIEFGQHYDELVLNSANKGWFNILHAHGENIIFNVIKNYPIQVFNWHAWETLPDIDEAISLSGKCILGGIKRFDITESNYNEIRNQIFKTLKMSNKRNVILSPGCVIRYPLDEKTLMYIRNTKSNIEKNI